MNLSSTGPDYIECEEIVTERNRLWQNVKHRALYGIVNEMEDTSAESNCFYIQML